MYQQIVHNYENIIRVHSTTAINKPECYYLLLTVLYYFLPWFFKENILLAHIPQAPPLSLPHPVSLSVLSF